MGGLANGLTHGRKKRKPAHLMNVLKESQVICV